MRGRWRYDEKAGRFVPMTDDRVPYGDLSDAEKALERREDDQREKDAHPGNYA